MSEQRWNDWLEVVQLASTITFSFEEDALIWCFASNGTYSSQSLYRIINFRGIISMHVWAVWSLKISPRVHFFLWLSAKNKLLTNLNIRKKLDDVNCLFCSKNESAHHLFFDCVVLRQIWSMISECLGVNIDDNTSVAAMWLSNKYFLSS